MQKLRLLQQEVLSPQKNKKQCARRKKYRVQLGTLDELSGWKGLLYMCHPTNNGSQYKQLQKLSKIEHELIGLERFSNDCRKAKTKAITPTNHNRSRQCDESTTIPRNYL